MESHNPDQLNNSSNQRTSRQYLQAVISDKGSHKLNLESDNTKRKRINVIMKGDDMSQEFDSELESPQSESDNLKLPDEFEEFRARSYSGGFLMTEWPVNRERMARASEGDILNFNLSKPDAPVRRASDIPQTRRYESVTHVSTDNHILRHRKTPKHERKEHRRTSHDSLQVQPKGSDSNSHKFVYNASHKTEMCFSEPDDIGRNHSLNTHHHTAEPFKHNMRRPPKIEVSLHRPVHTQAPSEWEIDANKQDELDDVDERTEGSWIRPRVYSLPAAPPYRPRLSQLHKDFRLQRMRSFTITNKGLRKEYKEIKNPVPCPHENVSSTDSEASHPAEVARQSPDVIKQRSHHVVLLGQHNVGKRAIIRRFVTEADISCSFDDESYHPISIQLEGEESTMEFSDMSDTQVFPYTQKGDTADAYVVVYSVEDRRSFESAIESLCEIREAVGKSVALILVANKTDLVRSRHVHEQEGRTAAQTYDSKYIEVSAAIDHNIDELLVGVLKQIRLIQKKYHTHKSGWRMGRDPSNFLDGCCLLQARANVLSKIFGVDGRRAKSTGNLYVL